MFHSEIIGAKSRNLDSFFFDENTLRFLLAEGAADCDVSVIEASWLLRRAAPDGRARELLRGRRPHPDARRPES
jgi:hypothetical protein